MIFLVLSWFITFICYCDLVWVLCSCSLSILLGLPSALIFFWLVQYQYFSGAGWKSLTEKQKQICVSISLLCSKLDTGTGKVIKFINFAFMFGRTDYSHCSLIHTYTPAATWSSMPYTSGGKSCMYKSSYKRGYCFQAIEAFGEPCVCDYVLVLLTMSTLTVSFIIDELQMWRKFSE